MSIELGLEGMSAVISGSTRGVGLAVAAALASAGAKVAVNYFSNEEKARAALQLLETLCPDAISVKADVSTEEGARRLLSEAESVFGKVDIIVNNAHGRIRRSFFPVSTWEEHQEHLEGVLKCAFNLTKPGIEGMKSRGWGRIVNVGNNMVLQPVKGYSALTSAMGALLGFTRDLAVEAGPWGITVNMVSPGFVMTEEAPHTNGAVLEAITAATPLGRLASPDDIAGAVLFFCSDLARFVTGANLSVDGGKVMG